MSLVAYDSSDESENEDEINKESEIKTNIQETTVKSVNIKTELESPALETKQVNGINNEAEDSCKINFNVIPKPVSVEVNNKVDIQEVDNVPMPKKIDYANIEKPPKKEKGPIKISIPSLTDFKDLEEESDQNYQKRIPSQKVSGLVNILPPPKGSTITVKNNSMVPYVLTKNSIVTKPSVAHTIKKVHKSTVETKPITSTFTSLSNYNSDSEEEDDKISSSGSDFFSLSNSRKSPDKNLQAASNIDIDDITSISLPNKSTNNQENFIKQDNEPNKTLVSNVMNLPKEEILLKNKAEVGPKLPIPEQEYNVDSEGNVAFDEKAIEYLCGKRGIKRKNEFNNVDIIEINGEDIKPDEREWLVKALTEEAPTRPISAGTGPGGQSKKKHQITYLAHQAKAMELELKNQWAQNKASRQQTRSKYGF